MSESWYIPIVGHPSAGKSTLIRLLTGVKVSVGKRSGTTKKINTIPVTEHLSILDFPGFGKVSRRSKSFADYLQNKIVTHLEEISSHILVGIVISDLSNIELMAQKLDTRGIIPIDFELTEFIHELSKKKPIVLGNKIDKLEHLDNLDNYLKFFPEEIDFFPISLKNKIGLEPFLSYLQMICDEYLPSETETLFWKG